jgi:tetratricopeptide (TPR) repeat protein
MNFVVGMLHSAQLGSPMLACLLLGAPPLRAQTDSAPPSEAIIHLMQSGATAIHRGKPAEAESFFQQAIAAAPNLPDAYLGLGMSELRQGKTGEAVEAIQKAVALAPQLPGAHMFLGIAQYQRNQMDAAIASLQIEVQIQPENVEALTWLGIVELGAGHAQEAVGPLDRAAALSPKDPNVLDYRGRAHTQVAEESFRALTALDPDSWRVHRALGEIAVQSKQYEQAIAEYRKALEKQPNDPDLYQVIGDCYQHLSRSDDAAQAYQAQLQISPNSPVALYNLGKIEVQKGDAERGVTLLRKAVETHALAAPTAYYLGLGLAQTGHSEEAAEWLEKSLTESPSDFIRQGAYFQLARLYQALHRKDDAQRVAKLLQEFESKKRASKLETALPVAEQSH